MKNRCNKVKGVIDDIIKVSKEKTLIKDFYEDVDFFDEDVELGGGLEVIEDEDMEIGERVEILLDPEFFQERK